MNSTNSIFKQHNATICISIDEYENLKECKKELIQIKEDLKLFLGDDL